MKKKLLIMLMAMPIFLLGQKNICFEHMYVEKDSIFCYKTSTITNLLTDYKIIFCKKDSLGEGRIVKNLMIQFKDSSNMFVSSDIYKDGCEIKTTYVEYGDNKKVLCLKETDRKKYPRFFKKLDIILEKMLLTSSQ